MCGGRHHPSEKKEKQLAHRKERRKVKEQLGAKGNRSPEIRLLDEESSLVLPHKREIDDVWGRSKDGKIRFNPKKEPKLMRK